MWLMTCWVFICFFWSIKPVLIRVRVCLDNMIGPSLTSPPLFLIKKRTTKILYIISMEFNFGMDIFQILKIIPIKLKMSLNSFYQIIKIFPSIIRKVAIIGIDFFFYSKNYSDWSIIDHMILSYKSIISINLIFLSIISTVVNFSIFFQLKKYSNQAQNLKIYSYHIYLPNFMSLGLLFWMWSYKNAVILDPVWLIDAWFKIF